MSLRVHAFFHVAFERLGAIYDWLAENNCVLTTTNFYDKNHKLPELSSIDMLIIMGGPMSVNDEAEHPWLKKEKQFLLQALNSNIPVLGICLGSQMIADVLGAKVECNKQKEIGWFDIEFTNEFLMNSKFSFLQKKQKFFHWHGEIFDLPAGAVKIGSSTITPNQGFVYKDRAIGLQFHPEANVKACAELKNNCLDDLKIESEYVQGPAQICEGSQEHSLHGQRFLYAVLDYLKARAK